MNPADVICFSKVTSSVCAIPAVIPVPIQILITASPLGTLQSLFLTAARMILQKQASLPTADPVMVL
jgi:hypothetical protein